MAPIIDLAARRHPQPSIVPPPPPPVRRPSGFYVVSAIEARRRAFRELTEAAARAYDAAAVHRLAGDETGAALLVGAAAEAMHQAQAYGEEIARL